MIPRLTKLSKSHSFFLFGPRACGKSTLLKKHFNIQSDNPSLSNKKVLWIDLLESKTHYKLSQNPDFLLDMWNLHKPKWIVIDEVQKIPKLLDSVHKMIEDHGVKFALSGSSARKLKKGQANLLAGRAISINLSLFSSFELKNNFNLNKALRFGLFPRFWSDEKITDKDKIRSLYAYVSTYLKEEIAAEQIVRNLDPFRRFLSVAAQSNSQIINFSKIERDSGIGSSQASKHFEVLIDTLIGHFLEPYHNSIRKRQTKKSKFYFFDTGVIRALNLLAEESLNSSTYEYGNLFETFIINEVLKHIFALEKKWKLSYLQTQSGVEVDLIIEKPRTPPLLIEIKSTTSIKKEHLQSLEKVKKDFPKSKAYILYRGVKSFKHNDIYCLPWQEGLVSIFK